MFDSLSDRFDNIFGRLRGKGKLNEQDVDNALSEIRKALLEADVAVSVARQFVEQVKSRLVGVETSKSLSPSQQVIKAVHLELVAMLGGEQLSGTQRGERGAPVADERDVAAGALYVSLAQRD